MRNLITRKEALKNEVFASFIGTWQKRFDPSEDPYMVKEGIYFDEELDKKRFFPQSELDSLNEKELIEYQNLRDKIEIKKYEYFGELKYNLEFNDIFIYSLELGKTLKRLSEELNSDIIFLLDYGVPWLLQSNDFQPVNEALKYLSKIGATEDYIGGFSLNGEELAEFVSKLFWIIRCNASLPNCWFSTSNHAFVGDICKYGNLHIHTYSKNLKNTIEKFASNNSLIEIEDCIQAFTDSGEIQGRQIVI